MPGSGDLPPRNLDDIRWSEYNHHWAGLFVVLMGVLALANQAKLARPVTKHWPLVLLGLAVSYWAMERRGWRPRWLVVLGQSALFLYFLHQIIAYRVVHQWLQWSVDSWSGFAAANLVFLLVLLGCGWAWRELTSWMARRGQPVVALP